MKITKKGFTLTEVLVVVLIISVLAAIVYPMYTKSITRSRAIEAINLLEMVRNKQLQKFARDQKYYTDLSKIGQLTSDSSAATVDGEKLKINDYTLSLDPVKNCMRAEYKKGSTEFTFSASYEKSGLGCTGSICSSFGSVTSTADQVCGCNITCSGGFTKDAASCSCTCSACVKDGQCVPAYLDKPLSESCGNGGTRSRTCTPSCDGGDCGEWGLCGSQTCDPALKPSETKACEYCGIQTRTVTCNQNTGVWTSGEWGNCTNKGVCSSGTTEEQTCQFSTTVKNTRTCSAACTWGAWTGCPNREKCPTTCPNGQQRDTAITYTDEGKCCVAACASTQKERCEDNHYGPAGTFNSASCSCSCPGGSVLDSSDGNCVCPSDKPNWDGSKCAAQADKCKDASYAASHKCECSPSIYNCCTQEEGEARDIIFDPVTRTCHCPNNMYLDGQAGCVCESGYVSQNKALCCPNEPSTNETCWTEKSNAKWKYVKTVEDRGCGGSYTDNTDCGNVPYTGPAGQPCPTPGATCKVHNCWKNSGGGQDWDDQYSGNYQHYTCSGNVTYSRNGW